MTQLFIRQLPQNYNTMMKSKTINVSVKCNPKIVYDFVSNLDNLPKWAPGTFPSIKKVDDELSVDIMQGQNKLGLLREIILES